MSLRYDEYKLNEVMKNIPNNTY